ncbi:MAG: SagB/ThcOx family dehydrogenase, partial [Candidatus Omnitrophica bacterium]|nr:SagB/ThcOx family dehydrogenase [Candidatus Omnitrophota bacterium]
MLKRTKRVLAVSLFVFCFFLIEGVKAMPNNTEIKLPEPVRKGTCSVEEAIQKRKSVRDFSDRSLTMEEVSKILWAAGGITVDGVTGPTRAYPSAGALYPHEIYLVAGKVNSLEAGIYRYNWQDNSLVLIKKGDARAALSAAAAGQGMIIEAPITLVVTASVAKV